MNSVVEDYVRSEHPDFKILDSKHDKFFLIEMTDTVDKLELCRYKCTSIVQDGKNLLDNVPDNLFIISHGDKESAVYNDLFPTFPYRNVLGLNRMGPTLILSNIGGGCATVVHHNIIEVDEHGNNPFFKFSY